MLLLLVYRFNHISRWLVVGSKRTGNHVNVEYHFWAFKNIAIRFVRLSLFIQNAMVFQFGSDFGGGLNILPLSTLP